jgi:hypothetical protein
LEEKRKKKTIRSRGQEINFRIRVDFYFLNFFDTRVVKKRDKQGKVPSSIWGNEVRDNKIGRVKVRGDKRSERGDSWNLGGLRLGETRGKRG